MPLRGIKHETKVECNEDCIKHAGDVCDRHKQKNRLSKGKHNLMYVFLSFDECNTHSAVREFFSVNARRNLRNFKAKEIKTEAGISKQTLYMLIHVEFSERKE